MMPHSKTRGQGAFWYALVRPPICPAICPSVWKFYRSGKAEASLSIPCPMDTFLIYFHFVIIFYRNFSTSKRFTKREIFYKHLTSMNLSIKILDKKRNAKFTCICVFMHLYDVFTGCKYHVPEYTKYGWQFGHFWCSNNKTNKESTCLSCSEREEDVWRGTDDSTGKVIP